jgi:hypothetical protein
LENRFGHNRVIFVISVSKLVQKDDGPEDIEVIISTFNKYGDKNLDP